MRCFSFRNASGLGLLLALRAAAADPEPVKLQNPATLEAAAQQITVASSNKRLDFAAAAAELSDKGSWRILLGSTQISIRDLLLNVDTRTITLKYLGRDLGTFDAAEIRNGDLKVEYVPGRLLLDIPTGPKEPNAARGALNGCLAYGLSSSKKKADIDITGGVQAGVGTKPEYFWSVKAQCGLLGSVERFGKIGPSFTAEASQQQNADPDSLKAAITWRKLHAFRNNPNGWEFMADGLRYEFERKLKKEPVLTNAGNPAARQFLEKNSNLMWSGIARYAYNHPSVNWTLGVAGFEAGRTLSRTVKKDSTSAEQQRVSRLLFDFDVYKDLFTAGGKRLVTFHGNHTLRLPFVPEPYVEAGVHGGDMYLTDKPRHWSEVEIAFLVSNGAAINVQYKRGSLPPTFEFVDHQVTVGFNLLLKAH